MDNQHQQNRGFLPDKIEPEDFLFGGHQLSENVLQSDGQWDNFLPVKELQNKNNLETMNCVVFATLNCLEVLFKKLTGTEDNFSDRYVGVMSETTTMGNSPQKVIQCIRHNGLIDEELLPFDKAIGNWNDYYSPKPMISELIEEGKKWTTRYKVGHEWLSNRDPETLKQALKFSPLGVSVRFNRKNEKGYYFKSEYPDNHWIMIFGFEEGKYWKAFDHYDNIFKKIDWGYRFDFVKRYSLEEQPIIKKSFWQKFYAYLKELFKCYFI